MTTIAYRDGILAADSKAYGGKFCASPGEKSKLHRIAKGRLKGWLVGISSNSVGADTLLLDWIARGAPLPTSGDMRPDEFVILALAPDGSLYLANDNLGFSGPITSAYYAIGSGADFALGAMAMGASAAQAVATAALFDPHTGGAVHTLKLES